MQFDTGKEGERGRMEALDYSAKIKKDVGKGTLDEMGFLNPLFSAGRVT